MAASAWRRCLIGSWFALTCVTFVVIGNADMRSWLMLLVFGLIPPAMLVWFWNENRPLPVAFLRVRRRP